MAEPVKFDLTKIDFPLSEAIVTLLMAPGDVYQVHVYQTRLWGYGIDVFEHKDFDVAIAVLKEARSIIAAAVALTES